MADNKDLIENLFESIDLLIDSKLKDLEYDKTELCTIEEVKGNKEYYVSNGSAKYVAYAQGDAEYKEGNSVYVTIPKGDYNNQKLIIGKYTLNKNNPLNWVSPMENFVNITGNITNHIEKEGLIANGSDYNKLLWSISNSNKIYTQYDRLCISADFSNSLIKHMVIEGSYGLILKGKKSNTELDIELAKVLNRIEEELKKGTINNSEAEKLRTQAKEKFNFELVFDCSDMLGNPYDFAVPYKQEIMFELSPGDKFSDLQLYFYQGYYKNGQTVKTFRGINNELINEEQTNTENDIFVENVSVNFGYSFNNYKDETAVLYTLDSLNYKKDVINVENKPVKEIFLRWVHYDNDRVYSITDSGHSTLKDHYVKVHWYRYDLQSDPDDKDPLAGYFWKEITENLDKFNLKIDLDPTWIKERFKVVIEYDNKIIKSQVVEFTNPAGEVGVSSMITGLNIVYPKDDEYRGTFYIYGDNHLASFSTERVFKLIADYKTLDGDHEYWEGSDIICWKFPKENTMIHEPEKGFEYFDEDIFLRAGSNESAIVNGITFTADSNYHYIIRRIKIVTDINGGNPNTEESRTQGYRILPNYVGTANDNTIKCKVYKPTSAIGAVEAQITFTFGLHTTNGTKYTLAVNWVETAISGTYQQPPAITAGDTQRWDFNVKILDSDQREIDKPEGGWNIELSWFEDRVDNGTINNLLNISGNTLTVGAGNLLSNALYQILKIKVTNFEYGLTTMIPIPIRANRNIVALEGADRVIYNINGFNPKWNNKKYNLIIKDENNSNITWELKSTIEEIINGDEKKSYLRTQIPRLEKNFLVVPDTYLPQRDNKYEGISVIGKNGSNVLWVQPIYVTKDIYGSAFFNEWDGKMKIDEENNTILASVIGAGRKNFEDNSFSGVVLGEIERTTQVESERATGILGLHHNEPSFGFLDDGSAFLGKDGKGQIHFNGSQGYIMSGNFDGFGNAGTKPSFNNTGEETNWGSKIPTEGSYIGLKTGRAWFAGDVGVSGTIYSTKGNIGGWALDTNQLSSGTTYLYSSDQSAKSSVKSTSLNTWRIKVGNAFGVDSSGKLYSQGASISGNIEISDGGSVGDWTVNDNGLNNGGNTPSIYLSAKGIGKNSLKVNSNAPGGNGWSIYSNGNFGVDTTGKLFATGATISGAITATSLNLGSIKIPSGNITLPDDVILDSDISVSTTTNTANGTVTKKITVNGKEYSTITSSNGSYLLTDIGKGSPIGDLTSPNQTNKYFKVSSDGLLTAHNAIIYGTIYANAGQIAGWSITSNVISAYNEGKGYTVLKPGGSVGLVFGSPSSTDTTGAKIQIWHDGTIRAGYNGSGYNFIANSDGSVTIKGKITATSGTIGGCTIDSNGNLKVPGGRISGGTISGVSLSIGTSGTNPALEVSSKGGLTLYGWDDQLYVYGRATILGGIFIKYDGTLKIGAQELTEELILKLKNL